MKAESAVRDISGDDKKGVKFPLASISKIVTSLWALETLGPDYRFTTKLHVNRVSSNSYDIHIEGSRDPIFGRNVSYFIISELNQKNIDIRNIETLTFDENFLIDWLSEESPRIAGSTPYYTSAQLQIDAVRSSLIDNFITPISFGDYSDLKSRAGKIGVQMVARPTINVRKVEFKSKNSFRTNSETITLTYRSAPLRTILKRMNNQSNNYIADNLFWNLGGTKSFNIFVAQKLNLTNENIEFYLGSGNNADYIFNTNQPVYNQASCETMIKVIFRLEKLLTQSGYKLSDVMAVAGIDTTSTIAGYGGNMNGSVTAKTGSVNKAKTLAGTLSTKNGTIYFVVLMHTDNRAEWGPASAVIRSKVNDLIVKNGGPEKINYKEIFALPFDKESSLRVLMQNRIN
jgi:D-alanyl-D-alanine carboxypeptidase